MKIGKYISELLFEKDFVILPGFGEFSTKYIPARFIPEKKKVESPSKVISFSDKNKNDDGLLAGHIANRESMPLENARNFLDTFVAEMHNTLNAGKSVELENVGKFTSGVGGSVLFEGDTSINYLSDTVGMSSVAEPEKKSPEEAKTEIDKVLEQAASTKPVVEEPKPKADPVAAPKVAAKPRVVVEPEKKPGLSPAVKWVAFTIVPLLVLAIILAFNYEYLFGDKAVVFGKKAKTPAAAVVTTTPESAVSEQPAAHAPAAQTPAVSQPATDTFDYTAAPPKPERGRKVYYIVVGSFEEEHSAAILAEELRRKGARTADVFPPNRAGFYRVTYGYYYDLKEAERDLPQAQQTVNPNAWILHR